MAAGFSDEALQIIETIKHLRLDCEGACLLNELTIAFEEKIDDVSFGKMTTGVKRSANAVHKSLFSNLLLTLTRAYDPWNGKNQKDRKCLQAIFGSLDKNESLFDELIQSEHQKELFKQARDKWHSLDKSYSYHIIVLKIEQENGEISKDEYERQREKLNIKNIFKGPRDETLAHNLPTTKPQPTYDELRSLLSSTLEIVGPLSEAFGGVSVSFESVVQVSKRQAHEYWQLWQLT